MQLSVSVIVCTHTDRRLELLVDCVDSLVANSRPPHEVVVVVDSNPDLLARLPGRLPPAVAVLPSRGSGASEARNTGIEAATGDLVAFIDDDAVADRGWLDHLTAPFADPAVVATGGRAVPRWERPNRILPPELYWVVGCTYAGHPTTAQPLSRPIGCSMAARRDAILDAGGFPHDFGPSGPQPKSHSNEEIAVSLRLRATHGERSIWYAPGAVVHHFVPAARTTWTYLWQRCYVEGVSKADVRRRFGAAAMGFDRGYARHTLLPAIARYAIRGLVPGGAAGATSRRWAVAAAGGLLTTAAGYAGRLLTAPTRPAPQALVRPVKTVRS
jgi:GT2 family glycosyltransferase